MDSPLSLLEYRPIPTTPLCQCGLRSCPHHLPVCVLQSVTVHPLEYTNSVRPAISSLVEARQPLCFSVDRDSGSSLFFQIGCTKILQNSPQPPSFRKTIGPIGFQALLDPGPPLYHPQRPFHPFLHLHLLHADFPQLPLLHRSGSSTHRHHHDSPQFSSTMCLKGPIAVRPQ